MLLGKHTESEPEGLRKSNKLKQSGGCGNYSEHGQLLVISAASPRLASIE